MTEELKSSTRTDDEYDMFAKFIASKIRKLRNPNMRDIVMNDVHNMVVRACMSDRQNNRYNSQYPESFSQASQSAFYQFIAYPHTNKTDDSRKPNNDPLSTTKNTSSSGMESDVFRVDMPEVENSCFQEEFLLDT